MSEAEGPLPAEEGGTAPSAPKTSVPQERAPNRTWFVVLAWITMIVFGAFVAWITVLAVMIPGLRGTP